MILLHGWPYDIHSYVDVAPALAAKGYRVIVPFLRGYGTTTFRSADTSRNGQQSAVALDIIALMDALKSRRPLSAVSTGARGPPAIIAALWPERCKALVAVSGYLITNLEANLQAAAARSRIRHGGTSTTSPPSAAPLATSRTRHDFNKLIWKTASPKWNFDDATYDRTASAFDQPRSRRRRGPQLPVAAEPRQRRAAIRHARAATVRTRRSSRCPRSPSPATSTVPPSTARHTEISSRASTLIASSPASATTCHKKPHRNSRMPLSMSTVTDRPGADLVTAAAKNRQPATCWATR